MSLAPQNIPHADQAKKPLSHSKISALSAIDLVCVLDVGLFEISLRLNDKPSALSPKMDLRATVSGGHLRTCSDSGDALAQILFYMSEDGDLVDPSHPKKDELTDNLAASKQPLVWTSPCSSSTPDVSEEQQQRVNMLMEEAMKESIFVPSGKRFNQQN